MHEFNVPDINNNKRVGSKKTLEDYIADGEHMMKGIIEETSNITYEVIISIVIQLGVNVKFDTDK